MKWSRLIVILLAVIAFVAFFYPKYAGGPLCGPDCPSRGLHNWQKPCIGFMLRENISGSYIDKCYGISYGKPTCFGVPFDAEQMNDTKIDCKYPCSDQWVRSQCTQLEFLMYPDYKVDCFGLQKKCNWK